MGIHVLDCHNTKLKKNNWSTIARFENNNKICKLSHEMNPLAKNATLLALFLGIVSVFFGVVTASEDVSRFDKLVTDIRKVIESSSLVVDDEESCNEICQLLDNDDNIGMYLLKQFQRFCKEKCPEMIQNAWGLDAEDNMPLQDKTLANFILSALSDTTSSEDLFRLQNHLAGIDCGIIYTLNDLFICISHTSL